MTLKGDPVITAVNKHRVKPGHTKAHKNLPDSKMMKVVKHLMCVNTLREYLDNRWREWIQLHRKLNVAGRILR